MGLDSYLYESKSGYLLKNGKISNKFKSYREDKFGIGNHIEIKTTVLYLRKANEIHNWFVENVQNGNDDCGEYEVSYENLHRLYDTCKKIIDVVDGTKMFIPKKYLNKAWYKDMEKEFTFDSKNLKKMVDCGLWNYHFKNDKANEIIKDNLPPRDGFFFGSTEIDGGYLYDIAKTILMLNNIFKELKIEEKNKDFPTFYYQASW